MRNIAFVLVIWTVCIISLSAQDPFPKYLDSKPPVISHEISLKDSAGIIIRDIVFNFRDSSTVYAVIVTPKGTGKHPGILVLHGGKASAERDKAISWAQRGYIAVAPDLPGIADPKKLIYTKGRWNKLEFGAERFTVLPDITSSTIFDAVLTAMKSLYLLQTQPTVDKNKIGVVGVSWGGYMTTMVCGLAGKQIKAGFSVFGSGFYEYTTSQTHLNKMSEIEKNQWLQYLDAGRRAQGIKASFFIAAATNDFFFFPKAVQKTLEVITSEKNQVFAPNVSHTISLPGGSLKSETTDPSFIPTKDQPFPTPIGNKQNWLAMEVPYMDYYLMGIGKPFPKIKVEKTNLPQLASFRITAPLPISKIEIYWSVDCSDSQKIKWEMIQVANRKKDLYQIQLPVNAVQWFVVASDKRPVSVSSTIIHCLKQE